MANLSPVNDILIFSPQRRQRSTEENQSTEPAVFLCGEFVTSDRFVSVDEVILYPVLNILKQYPYYVTPGFRISENASISTAYDHYDSQESLGLLFFISSITRV